MKRLTLQWLACTVMGASCLLSFSFAAEPLPVVASFSILGDLVRVVGGNRVTVTTLVGPDEDAHTFEPKPTDARSILNSKLMVMNGLHFEPWAQKLRESAGFKGNTVVASDGIAPRVMPKHDEHHEHPAQGHYHAIDPHAWQNPNHVIVYVRNIAAGLSKADPPGAATYKTHAENYVKELQALDALIKAQLAGIAPEKRKVIISHDAMGYFGDDYRVAFFSPQGLNTDAEPSAKDVAQLVRQIQREKIKAVFIEHMSSSKMMEQISRDTGAVVGLRLYSDALSSADKPGATYLQMMRYNVTQLVTGMKRN